MPWALVGARVWAGPEDGFAGEAMAFGADGRVAAVGSEAHVRSALAAGAPVRDVGDRLVVPGFVDAHAHVRAGAQARLAPDASGARSRADLLALVAAEARRRPAGALVSLGGLEPAELHDGLPGRAELDRAGGGRPVVVRLRSLHGWLLSSAALAAAGLPRTAPDLVVDHGGRLRGLRGRLSGDAGLRAAVAGWSADRLAEGVVALLDATATNGPDELAALRAWRRDGALRQAVSALAAAPAPGATGLKVMPTPGGDLSAQLAEGLRAGWRHGLTVAVHCADAETMGALVEVAEAVPRAERGRLRIEHASVCPEEWIGRVAALGATVVTHPGFVWAHGERYLREEALGPPPWLYRLRSWLSAGVALAVGSDAPAGPAAPLLALRAALTRRTAAGRELGAAEALDAAQALAALTAWAADHSGLPGHGRLRPGAGAAVVLDGDPFDTDGLDNLAIHAVVVEGKPVAL